MTDATDIAALMRSMRDLADRIVECEGENSEGEESIHLYDQSDTTFIAQNILLVLNAFEAERQRADAAHKYASERDTENESLMLTVGRIREEIAALKAKLANPVALPERRSSTSFVDDEFTNKDLAAIYNAARLEFKVKVLNAGFTVKGGE